MKDLENWLTCCLLQLDKEKEIGKSSKNKKTFEGYPIMSC